MTNSRRTGTHDGAVGVPFGSIFPRLSCLMLYKLDFNSQFKILIYNLLPQLSLLECFQVMITAL